MKKSSTQNLRQGRPNFVATWYHLVSPLRQTGRDRLHCRSNGRSRENLLSCEWISTRFLSPAPRWYIRHLANPHHCQHRKRITISLPKASPLWTTLKYFVEWQCFSTLLKNPQANEEGMWCQTAVKENLSSLNKWERWGYMNSTMQQT